MHIHIYAYISPLLQVCQISIFIHLCMCIYIYAYIPPLLQVCPISLPRNYQSAQPCASAPLQPLALEAL